MTPQIHFWTGWDAIAVLWLLAGLILVGLIPTAIVNYAGQERALLLITLLCAGPLFILAAYGRRIRRMTHTQQEHPRPYDAPD